MPRRQDGCKNKTTTLPQQQILDDQSIIALALPEASPQAGSEWPM